MTSEAGAVPTTDPHGLVIAIDGTSGSGKSSTSRGVASRLGLRYLDTGAMYRAVAWAALNRSVDVHDERALAKLMEGIRLDIRTAEGHFPEATAVFVDGEEGPMRGLNVDAVADDEGLKIDEQPGDPPFLGERGKRRGARSRPHGEAFGGFGLGEGQHHHLPGGFRPEVGPTGRRPGDNGLELLHCVPIRLRDDPACAIVR